MKTVEVGTATSPFLCVYEHKHTSLLDECVHVCVNMQARG